MSECGEQKQTRNHSMNKLCCVGHTVVRDHGERSSGSFHGIGRCWGKLIIQLGLLTRSRCALSILQPYSSKDTVISDTAGSREVEGTDPPKLDTGKKTSSWSILRLSHWMQARELFLKWTRSQPGIELYDDIDIFHEFKQVRNEIERRLPSSFFPVACLSALEILFI